MFLTKATIYNFRNLVNQTIDFERGFIPSVFILCGDNGSGKSNFLKIIFGLLSAYKRNYKYIYDLLRYGERSKSLAEIELLSSDNNFYRVTLFNDMEISSENQENIKVALFLPEYELDKELWKDDSMKGLYSYATFHVALSYGQEKIRTISNCISNLHDTIILMDNFDDGLSPDNVDTLMKIIIDNSQSNNNQFIIVAHNVSACYSLTPSHIKELQRTRMAEFEFNLNE